MKATYWLYFLWDSKRSVIHITMRVVDVRRVSVSTSIIHGPFRIGLNARRLLSTSHRLLIFNITNNIFGHALLMAEIAIADICLFTLIFFSFLSFDSVFFLILFTHWWCEEEQKFSSRRLLNTKQQLITHMHTHPKSQESRVNEWVSDSISRAKISEKRNYVWGQQSHNGKQH